MFVFNILAIINYFLDFTTVQIPYAQYQIGNPNVRYIAKQS